MKCDNCGEEISIWQITYSINSWWPNVSTQKILKDLKSTAFQAIKEVSIQTWS
jgi:hypothetical protein